MMFAREAGLQDEALQKWYELAVAERSALKRMIHRQGTPGYSLDAKRSLASFITSNARYVSNLVNTAEMQQAAKDVRDGGVQDEAVKLVEYVTKPTEEAAAIRGLMFTWYLGGSLAAGLVNLTQPVLMTLPYLARFGAGNAAKAVKNGMAAAVASMRGKMIGDTELAQAMAKAAAAGRTDPSEIHALMAASRGEFQTPLMQAFHTAWGANFAVTEAFNRKTTFAAAFLAAREAGEPDPYSFAMQAVYDTQGLYCVDEGTEILTAAGWKRRADVSVGEAVFAIDKNGMLVEDTIKAVHVFPGRHEVTEFRNKNGLSLVVSDEHRNVIQNYNSRDKKWQRVRAVRTRDLKNSQFFLRVPLGDATGRKAVLTDDQVRLLAWVAAEGHFFAHRGTTEKRGVGITQSESHNPHFCAEIDELLKRLGGHYNRKLASAKARKDRIIQWQLRKPLWSFIHRELPEKRVTMALLNKLTVPQMRLFLETFAKGDGTGLDDGGRVVGQYSIGQKSIETLHTLQAMAVLTGNATTVWDRTRDTANGTLRDYGSLYVAANSKRAYVKEFERTRIVVDGVWCPETGSGTWIARRNGRTFITGNSRANRPNWARGTIGSTVFTFKQFSIAYVEFLKQLVKEGKLPKQQIAVALGMLVLASGIQGLPGADDLDDVIDALGQWLGYGTNVRQSKRQLFEQVLGKTMGNVAMYGISTTLGLDLSSRLGMGNLIPGTGALIPANPNKGRDIAEFAGPLGSLVTNSASAIERLFHGNFGGAAQAIMPTAVRNLAKGGEMLVTGEARDERGRKVNEVTPGEAVTKAIGFNPNTLAEESRRMREVRYDENIVNSKASEIRELWATGIARGDMDRVREAQDLLRNWNAQNPAMAIRVRPQDVMRRAKDIKRSRAERFVRSVPASLRERAREAITTDDDGEE
jgi:hypothetical protein